MTSCQFQFTGANPLSLEGTGLEKWPQAQTGVSNSTTQHTRYSVSQTLQQCSDIRAAVLHTDRVPNR